MIVKELERAGLPTAHVCTMTPVAIMVGSNRIVPGSGVIHPVGNVDLGSNEEKNLRRTIVQKAIEALHTELKEQTVFPRPSV